MIKLAIIACLAIAAASSKPIPPQPVRQFEFAEIVLWFVIMCVGGLLILRSTSKGRLQ